MTDNVKTAAARAVRRFVLASRVIEEARDALMPYAKEQAEIMKKVIRELKLSSEYKYIGIIVHEWIELEVGGFYEGSSPFPVINCQLWEGGRGYGNPDREVGSFRLSQHIINGQPEKFETEFRSKHEGEAKNKAQTQCEQKQRQIEHLQAELAKLQSELEDNV